MMFWVWAALIVAAVIGFVALLFGYVRLPQPAAATGGGDARRWPLVAGGALLLLLGGGLAGWLLRSGPEAPAEAPTAPADPAPAPQAEVGDLVAQLEAKLAASPGDPQGWRLLGYTRFQMGQFGEAVEAYGRARALAPEDGDTAAALGEAMVMAAEGRVTDEARDLFAEALARMPGDPRARYYLAAAKDQGGDTGGAIDDWIALINQSPPAAPLTIELRNLVTQRAREAGIDISGRLGAAAPRPEAAPGPSAAQVAGAEAMAPDDRAAMIRGMVDRLDARLADNPADPQGWQRLIRARMVLGEREEAEAALARAERALAGDAAGLAAVRAEAKAAGLSAG